MAASLEEIHRRESLARARIQAVFGIADDEDGPTLFVSHHLEEVESAFWEKHLGTATPEPRRVLDILVLKSHWGGSDEMQTFDFTLPEEATNYVVSVRFDEHGAISEMTMES